MKKFSLFIVIIFFLTPFFVNAKEEEKWILCTGKNEMTLKINSSCDSTKDQYKIDIGQLYCVNDRNLMNDEY